VQLTPPPPQDVIIVGGTGDLAQRKLLPAIYNLQLDGLLPAEGHIVGFARSQRSLDAYHEFAAESLARHSRRPFEAEAWEQLRKRMHFISEAEGGWAAVAQQCRLSNRLVYLATPPSAFGRVAQDLATHRLVEGTRLVIEKPFGRDLESAQELGATLHEYFDESQIFRIDHYMGKETVQNILVFRFGNSMFERTWNRDAIDHMQITISESIGVEGRGEFYEETGALRDIVQNHALQVLSLLTMEPPASFHAEAVRDEMVKLLHAVAPVPPSQVVRGQYDGGVIGEGIVPGYREEPGVAPDSETETLVAMRLAIDNWRWSGVPIYLRVGKRLPRRVTEVHVVFREAPISYFEGTPISDLHSNHLTLRIQPEEGISFSFMAKQPGPEVSAQQVRMNFNYGDSFMIEPQEAYERLLHDAMRGDHTLFLREDGVEQAWRIVEPVLRKPSELCFYDAGSWGPIEAETLLPTGWHLH
jgi:glucose-6-phosphate 1-dehydrogenase